MPPPSLDADVLPLDIPLDPPPDLPPEIAARTDAPLGERWIALDAPPPADAAELSNPR